MVIIPPSVLVFDCTVSYGSSMVPLAFFTFGSAIPCMLRQLCMDVDHPRFQSMWSTFHFDRSLFVPLVSVCLCWLSCTWYAFEPTLKCSFYWLCTYVCVCVCVSNRSGRSIYVIAVTVSKSSFVHSFMNVVSVYLPSSIYLPLSLSLSLSLSLHLSPSLSVCVCVCVCVCVPRSLARVAELLKRLIHLVDSRTIDCDDHRKKHHCIVLVAVAKCRALGSRFIEHCRCF